MVAAPIIMDNKCDGKVLREFFSSAFPVFYVVILAVLPIVQYNIL